MQVCEFFEGIARKLYEKPNTIEDLTSLRDYINSIPELLEEQQELIETILSHYELIDEFFYNLSDDDFNTKWTTLAWPNKIGKIVEDIEKHHEEDEERFRKLQIADLAAFSDKIDSLTVSLIDPYVAKGLTCYSSLLFYQMMVSSMASNSDIGKAHEIANEVRRLHKQLLEAQQSALLYNSRERLFDMPITNVSLYF